MKIILNKSDTIAPMPLKSSYTSERPDVLSLIPSGTTSLLDLGCSDGTLGLSIKNKLKQAQVTGVEFDSSMASLAEKRLDEVHIADLNKVDISELFSPGKFDCIIMADILEHLIDPWSIVKQASSLLSEKGIIITSIPNVRHVSTILSLIFKGKWPYRNRGIHDSTHLRFFTRSNIVEMFQKAGLKIIKEKRTMRIFEGGRKIARRINKISRFLDIPILRGFFTFQYLHVVKGWENE